MHEKPEPVQKNETHKILYDFEIKTDQLILAKLTDLVLIYKKRTHGVTIIGVGSLSF